MKKAVDAKSDEKADTKGMKTLAPGVYQKSGSTWYIRCSVSGKMCFCNKHHLDSLLKRFGSYEAIGAQYISRDAKRLLKADVPAKAISKMDVSELAESSEMLHVDKQTAKEKRAAKRAAKEEAAEKAFVERLVPNVSAASASMFKLFNGSQACIRPNLFRKNGGWCNGCGWIKICEYKDKAECTDETFVERIPEIEQLTGKVEIFTQEESEEKFREEMKKKG